MADHQHTGTPCPLCSTRVFLKFPDDYPSEETIATRYTHAVMAASAGVKRRACKIIGISFRALNRRLDRELKPSNRVETAGNRSRAFEAAEKAQALVPIGPAGVCAGTWVMSGKGTEARVYELWFNEGVRGVAAYTDVAPGSRPTVLVGEEDGTERVFEFGEVSDREAAAFTVPAGPKHSFVAVVNTEVGT